MSATTPTPRSDVDEIVDTVNELEKEAESKIKKEKEEPVELKPNPDDFMTDGKLWFYFCMIHKEHHFKLMT